MSDTRIEIYQDEEHKGDIEAPFIVAFGFKPEKEGVRAQTCVVGQGRECFFDLGLAAGSALKFMLDSAKGDTKKHIFGFLKGVEMGLSDKAEVEEEAREEIGDMLLRIVKERKAAKDGN